MRSIETNLQRGHTILIRQLRCSIRSITPSMWSINGSIMDHLDHSINARVRAVNRRLRQRTQRWNACARTGEAAAASRQGTNNNPANPHS